MYFQSWCRACRIAKRKSKNGGVRINPVNVVEQWTNGPEAGTAPARRG